MLTSYKDMVQNFFAKTRFKTESVEERAAFLYLLEQGSVAIISGYATTGEHWTDEENKASDRALLQELQQKSQQDLDHLIHPIRIIGYDPRGNHSEPSWATAIPLDQAIALGSKYKQIAIFYIAQGIQDTHTIHACLSEQPPYEVGRFLDQLD